MKIRHAAVWLDHKEARVFHVTKESFDETSIHAPHHQFRHAGPTPSGEKAQGSELERYYHEVSKALSEAEEILVLGPSTAKLELIRHLHRHDAAVAAKVVGVETVDHPTDKQIVAYVRKYFLKADAFLGNAVIADR